MNNGLVKTLELMCDMNHPQDKKLLLLAKLVDSKCEVLSKNQEDLKESLEKTNTKLDELTSILKNIKDATYECPVYKNKTEYSRISFFVKHPKMALLIILGLIALLGGLFGSGATAMIEKVFGL